MIKDGFPELTLPQVEEDEITLYIGNRLIQTFLCTPEALEELTIGHLYCRGLISSLRQISQIEICRNEIKVELKKEDAMEAPPSEPFHNPSLTFLQNLAGQIQNLAEKYRHHGGIHCAALSDGLNIVVLYEDVGRHNAFDKAIGAALNQGIDLSRLIYFSSGRINSEIAEKAAACRLSLLVSRSIATNRACAIAGRTETTIIGRIESKAPILYTACTRD
ncbi:formate dehydrogenase accessory sulfurtransferase FdhD [Oceanispirochaeta sp.]|jgi:FdhD protein|uniref:formate dehydrogenase accessory sulfurtransferase FdhD n=1 Tax=Oceanispirochaeta sp. TaxID=2035350 RepID=UPI00260DDCB7|nr:formate dehydrogenase accessory sulfurtransferase FdhD [Oceanispirochaeta sp.]MDA3956795.1 formate dehydrogenase accessory sulfurtransferase FdhD [Oceanispirochaeta sp.]